MAASEMMGECCVVGTQPTQVDNALHTGFASGLPEEYSGLAITLGKSVGVAHRMYEVISGIDTFEYVVQMLLVENISVEHFGSGKSSGEALSVAS
ncbi:MAG: hypothetical protein WAL67_02625 [Candidatus Cybelea sp.]